MGLALPEKNKMITLYYDGAGYYAYVLLRSSNKQSPVSSEEVENVKKVLRENGISTILSGRSFRPASNGQQYEWYIRVTEKGNKPSSAKISAVFEALSKGEQESPDEDVESQNTQNYIKQILENVEKERQENRKLILDLQSAKNEIKSLESDRDSLQQEMLKISQDLQRFEQIIQSKTEEYSFYEKELLEENQILKSRVESFLTENKRLHIERDNLEAQRKYYEDEFRRLDKEYKKLQSVLSKERISQPNTEDEFEILLTCLLPEVIFEKGSIDLLKNEIRYELALQKIKKILSGEAKPDDTIKRKGYATWFEYHFGSGQGHNNGRIYSAKGKDGKYRILIGLKETQDEDIKGLMDIPLQ